MEKKITQYDIAKALNIGLVTVNRALNNTGYVSDDLKEKIYAYAREVHYVANKAAQSLVRREVQTITLFSSEKPEFFWDDVEMGIEIAIKHLDHFNFNVSYVRISPFDNHMYVEKLKAAIKGGVAAIGIVNNNAFDMPTICALIEEHGIPYITFNIDDPSSKRICHIGPDYKQEGRLAAEFFGVSLRNKDHILIITSDFDSSPENSGVSTASVNALRLNGFQATLAERYPHLGCTIKKINQDKSSPHIRQEIAKMIAGERTHWAGIYSIAPFNTELTQAIAAEHQEGNAVTVVHDLFPGYRECFDKKLVTAVIYQNPILQGYYAVKMLETIVDHDEVTKYKDILLHSSVLLRENCDCYMNQYLFSRFEPLQLV